MQLCIRMCCEEKSCDVALMSGKNCYGVQCFSEMACRAVPVTKAPSSLMISHVTIKGEGAHENQTTTPTPHNLKCTVTDPKDGVTLNGGLKSGNFTDVGKVDGISTCTRLCCVSEKCDLALLIKNNCFLVSCFTADLCKTVKTETKNYRPTVAYVKRWTTALAEDSAMTLSTLPATDSKLSCKNSDVKQNFTLKGGYRAGNFTDLGKVSNMSTCIRYCCGRKDCDAAMMLEHNCYAVRCYSYELCRSVKARKSGLLRNLSPRLSYITSRSEEVMPQRIPIENGASCQPSVISYDVTLKGGIKAGTFTPIGYVDTMQTCVSLCCQRSSCDVAFMLKSTCYSIKCSSEEMCEQVQARANEYSPRLSYIRRFTSSDVTKGKNKTIAGHSGNSSNTNSVSDDHYCTESEIITNVTLRGGITAGRFRDRGRVPGIKECAEVCCIAKECDLAFMLEDRCFSVTCSSSSSCVAVAAKSSVFRPAIVYIYARTIADASMNAGKRRRERFRGRRADPESNTDNLTKTKRRKRLFGGNQTEPVTDASLNEKRLNERFREHRSVIDSNVEDSASTRRHHERFQVHHSVIDSGTNESTSTKRHHERFRAKHPTEPRKVQARANEYSPRLSYIRRFTSSDVTKEDDFMTEIGSVQPLTCDHGPIQTNVALRHELRSGKFWRLGLADDMSTCIQLCCEKEDCEMAMMPGQHCYGVDCFSEKHCEITGVKPTNMTVQIARVRPIVENPGIEKIFDIEDPSTKKELHCTHSPILTNVTVRGGVKAGKFSDMGEVAGMHMCTALCCERKSCDLAFMIGDTCIAVDCYREELCQAVRARPTSYNPQIAYVRRRELQSSIRKANELPKAPILAHKIVSDRLPHMTILKTSTCSSVKIHTNVTLLGGIKSGNFTALGRTKNMQECIGKSCDLPSGDMAFMLGNDCYSVTCYSDRQCQVIPAQPSPFLPKLAFLKWAPKVNETETLVDDVKPKRHIPRCTRSHILYNHTVQGGLRAGNFTKIAEVDSIETCAALCCAEETCDLALMLGENCYAGDCASRELCKPIPAYHKSEIAYITSRKKADNNIDWSLWYLVVGSIAIGIGLMGIAWTVGTCWKRTRRMRPKCEEADRFVMDNHGDTLRSMQMLPHGKYINQGPLFLSDTDSETEDELEAEPLPRKSLQGPGTLNLLHSYGAPTNNVPRMTNYQSFQQEQADLAKARRAMQNL
ncbi:predicted protein [Nematostella vectensis]|uniref:MANSC domain-containing protein n=1 Tax=Nematostella vectensis TaxID=45351 RepID=A7RSV7_NEMVE|nr:predicted protein [Nematostella vectensis]|eukprot:XP_001637589.1 predicted protein [Nematostella vectensis]